MKINLKKLSASLLGFFGIGALTACYGMPPNNDFTPYLVNGTVSSIDSNGDTQNVANINVSLIIGKETYITITDQYGYYQLDLPQLDSAFSIIFSDKNGVFQSDTLKCENSSNDNLLTYNILLKGSSNN